MSTYLVTGSNRGIGLELCNQIIARGDEVIATCRKASSDLKIKATKKNIPNPRKEMEEHYYNPKNTSLISLGLKPIQFNLETIKKNIRIIEKYKFNINQNYFNPTVKWEN